MQPQKIGVIGAGLMGHGIAYLLAAAGHSVGVPPRVGPHAQIVEHGEEGEHLSPLRDQADPELDGAAVTRRHSSVVLGTAARG